MLLLEPEDVLPVEEVLFDEVEPAADPEASLLAFPEVDPLVLGEAEDVSPLMLPLALPLGELMLPVEPLPEVLLPVLGLELVDPAAPPVVELEPELEVLGVCAGLVVSVLEGELDGVCEADPVLLLGVEVCVELELEGV